MLMSTFVTWVETSGASPSVFGNNHSSIPRFTAQPAAIYSFNPSQVKLSTWKNHRLYSILHLKQASAIREDDTVSEIRQGHWKLKEAADKLERGAQFLRKTALAGW